MTVSPAIHATSGLALAVRLPYLIVASLLGVELAAILLLNGGMLTYSLDDPYIHLAMAENLVRGHYGINLVEPSAPSSSIVWPFLMLPFSGTRLHDWWPLLVNAACALGSVAVLRRIVTRSLPDLAAHGPWLHTAIIVAAALGLNQVGLVFTGMEHSLQVLLALVLVDGLLVLVEERRCPWWLSLAIVAGPLVRYESTALSLAACLFLMIQGRAGLAVLLGAATAAPLGAFSWFLHRLGLEWLPSSVLLKSEVSPEGFTPWDMLVATVTTFLRDFPGHPSRLVLIGFAVLLAVACRRASLGSERRLAVAGLVAVLMHLAAGRYGWFGRYEIYILAAATTLLIYLWRDWLSRVLASLSLRRALIWIGAVTAAVFGPSLGTIVLTPFAANNIFEQQYQMHRFLTQFHDGPAAVNDLGWVSFRNDDNVLDVWGLGSIEAGSRRLDGTRGWMEALARRSGVDLAMIYEGWYVDQIPASWVLLGRLHLGGMQVTPAFSDVAFFAVDPAAAPELARQLAQFVPTLPAGVRFELTAEARAALGG